MDNLNYATFNESLLQSVYKQSREGLNKGGFNLRKWSSNSKTIQDLAKDDSIYEEAEVVKVLGMQWNV